MKVNNMKKQFTPPGKPFKDGEIKLNQFMMEVPGAGNDYSQALFRMYVYTSKEKEKKLPQ